MRLLQWYRHSFPACHVTIVDEENEVDAMGTRAQIARIKSTLARWCRARPRDLS